MSTIVAIGSFTSAELAQFMAVLREIEGKRPDEIFEVYIDAPEMQDTVEDLIAEINPLRTGYERMVKTRKRSQP